LLVAELLAGSWRSDVHPALLSPAEVSTISSLLLDTGAGPLAFRRAPACDPFKQAFQLSSLHSAIREEQTLATYHFLRCRGIAPFIMKGWVAARSYPDPACRPYVDVDVCVSPRDYEKARIAVRDTPPECGVIDLHRPTSLRALRGRSLHKIGDDLVELADRDWDDVVARSITIPAAGGEIRVLCPEDHLRVLALHYLKHGGWRPLWLCDIAAAVENRSPDFDWDRALGGDPWRTRCVRATLLLAHELLGMRLDGIPSAEMSRAPRWLAPAIFREWERPWRWPGRRPMIGGALLDRPSSLFREASRRWPGALESTINLRGPINDLPRFPLQFAQFVWRLPVIPRQMADEIRRRLNERRENVLPPERLP
jgi:hypothetical protein